MTARRFVAPFAWAVVVVDVVAVGVVAVGVLPEPPSSPAGGAWIYVFVTAVYGFVGARVVTRDGRNRVGWVLWVQPTLLALSGAAVGYAQVSVERFAGTLPATAALGWASGWSLVLFVMLTALVIPLLFPTGMLPSRRWRPVAALAMASIALTMASEMLPDTPTVPGVPNPVGDFGDDQVLTLLNQLGSIAFVVAQPFVIASIVQRFRRGTAVEREQVKWFALGSLVPSVLLVAALVAQDVQPLWAAGVASLGLVPVTIGIAILRYRLYEIDRIVSRTIAWAIVTGVLVGVFAVLVVTLETVLVPLTRENTLAVAASTLVAAALFQPLRGRVQRAVDRRFDRARYDGQLTVDAFAEQLRNQVDLTTIRSSLAVTADAAMRPASAIVWLTGGTT